MNSVSITGRMTRDPELRTTQSGTSVCSFSLAVDRPNVRDKVDFLDFVAWRNTADFVSKWFHKGDGIEVTGYITTRSYEDKNGVKRNVVEINCENVGFPKGKKQGGSYAPAESDAHVNEEGFTELTDDGELPF